VRNGAMILGPVLAGVLVATVGAGWALAIDAFSFVVAGLTLLKVALPPVPGGDSSAARPGMVQDLREGWGEFSSRTWLWVIVAAFGVTNAIHAGAWGVLGPVIAKNNASIGISGWGFVMSAEAVGMFAMALVLMKLNLRRPLRYGMIGVSLMLIPLTMLGLHPVTLAMVPAAFICGLGMETFGTGWNVAMMEQVPQEALSRVSSYDMLGSFVAVPVGTLFFGWIVTRASPETVLVTSGLTYAVVSLGTLLVPSVRNLRRLDDSPAKRESITE
jgi:MFS family permease